jgi:hypothetical protein
VIWKEAVVGLIKALTWHFPGRLEEDNKKPHSGYLLLWLKFELSFSSI